MKQRRGNLGKQLNEIMNIKLKMERELPKSQSNYVDTAVQAAKGIILKVNNEIKKLENKQQDEITFADNIFSILVEDDHKKLQKTKYVFDRWSNLNDMFNN